MKHRLTTKLRLAVIHALTFYGGADLFIGHNHVDSDWLRERARKINLVADRLDKGTL